MYAYWSFCDAVAPLRPVFARIPNFSSRRIGRMLFSSWQFIFVFLPISFLIYFWLNHRRLVFAGKAWLGVASLFFYAYWEIRYLPLILASMLINFAIGSGLSQSFDATASSTISAVRKRNRESMLAIGVLANLCLLAYFKYTDFFIENWNLAFEAKLSLAQLVLPLGISFFTFQQIAYLVDSYRGETADYDFVNYTLFVTFFPQLIAGPIVHHHEMMSQFASRWTLVIRYRNVLLGLVVFAIGLFKKVVIADTFAVWANAGFDSKVPLDFYAAWSASLSYSFQLYFDFSGYCDMAMGAALLFNIRLPINFNSPYKATSIQDFWRRWHITLSRFLRDYVYIPLGGNRRSPSRAYLNLFATFVIGGLWHGASWMFVIWGALHGVALVVHRIWASLRRPLPVALAWLFTFAFVNATWVFFRAKSMDDAIRVLRGMTDFTTLLRSDSANVAPTAMIWGGAFADFFTRIIPHGVTANISAYLAITAAFIIIRQANSNEILRGTVSTRLVGVAALLFVCATYVALAAKSSVFLYFNF
jgi:alginate O-acetyltransferase complex protein AlgI